MSAKVASLLIDVAANIASLRKDFDDAGKVVNGFGNKIAAVAKTLAGAFSVQQVIAFGEAIQSSVDAMADLAENLEIPVTDFQALQNSALLAGQSIEATGAALQKFTVFVGKAAEGGKDQIERLDQLGVKVLDLNGKLRPTSDILQEVSEAILSISDPAKRAAATVDVFGRAGQGVTKTMEQWAKGAGALNDELTKMGLVHGPEAVKAFADMADEADRTSKRIEVFFGYFYAIAKSNVFAVVAAGLQGISNAINSVKLGSAENMIKVITALALMGTIVGAPAGFALLAQGVDDSSTILTKQINATTASIAALEEQLEAYKRGGSKFAEQTMQTAGAIAQQQLQLSELRAKLQALNPATTTATANKPGAANPAVKSTGVDKFAEAQRKLLDDTNALKAAQDAYYESLSKGLPTADADRLAKHLQDISTKTAQLTKDLTPAQAAIISGLVKPLAEAQFAFAEVQRVQREGDATSRRYGDGQKELTDTIYRLIEQKNALTISEEEYAIALDDANQKAAEQRLIFEGQGEGLEQIAAGFQYAALKMQESQSSFQVGQELFTSSIGIMSSAITEFAQKGTIDFAKIAQSFAAMLADMAAKLAAQAALQAIIGAIGSAAGAATANASGFAPGAGPQGPSGGAVASEGGWFSNLFGGGRAIGGPVNPNYGYMVGESGPERFVPNVPGRIEPAGGGNVTINNNARGIDVQAERRPGGDLEVTIQAVRRALTRDVSRGGNEFASSLEQAYRVNRGRAV